MTSFFLKLCSMSITAGYVILIVIAVRFLLKKAPKIFSYALWGIVLFRLVCPFSFESLFSMLPSADPLPQKILLSPATVLHTGIPLIDGTVSLPAPSAGADSVNPMQVFAAVGAGIWLAGLLVLLCWSAFSLAKLRRNLRGAAYLQDKVYQCSGIETPFVMGCFRPRIYLPYGLDDTRRESVLLHERTHIRRGDIWIKPLAFLVLCVHWFNPLAWLAFILMSKDMELSCDERVLKQLGAGAKADYSALLLSFSASKPYIAGTPLAFGEKGAKTRIKNVLHYKKPTFWVLLAAVLALAGAVLLLVSNPKQKVEPALLPEAFVQKICDDAALSEGTAVLKIPNAMPDGYTSKELSIHVSGTAPMGEDTITLHAFESLAENFDFETGKTYTEQLFETETPDGVQLTLEVSLLEKDGSAQYSASAVLPYTNGIFKNKEEEMFARQLPGKLYETILDFTYADFDKDGKKEAFAIVGKAADKADATYLKGTLYFIGADGTVQALPNDGRLISRAVLIDFEDAALVAYVVTQGGPAREGFLYAVQNGTARRLGIMAPFAERENDVLLFTGEDYDFLTDGDDSPCGGHTWNPYYFYWQNEALYEYGGRALSEEQFATLAGGTKELDGLRAEGYVVKNILYRDNGYIQVNYRLESKNGDEVCYENYNRTYLWQNGVLQKTKEDGEGHYKPALEPELAVYPADLPQ